MYPSIVFFGTPQFGAEILDYLIDHGVEIRGVVTQPDRPKGRSLQLTVSPVKSVAQSRIPSAPIWQPLKCSDPQFLSEIAAVQADLYVVVAFGQILPKKLLEIPSMGCINVHASLLPKYRGAAPIQRSILQGDTETGVSIQKMVKELDAGDVIGETKVPIGEETTYGDLEKLLCEASKPLLLEILLRYSSGPIKAVPQDGSKVTWAPKIEPEEGEIIWTKPAKELQCQIRGFNPRPGAWVFVEMNGERKRLKIHRARISPLNGAAGEILPGKEFVVGCGVGALILLEVQLEGKPRMSAVDWRRGLKGTISFIKD